MSFFGAAPSGTTEFLAKEKGAPSALADQLKNCNKGEEGDTDAEKREFFEETQLEEKSCLLLKPWVRFFDLKSTRKVTDFLKGVMIKKT